MSPFSFFFPKIISRNFSPVNGEIQIVEQFGRKSIRVGGIEQSGPMVEKIWEKGINDITILPAFAAPSPKRLWRVGDKATAGRRYYDIKNCLVLGLGGGSAVKLINRYYPKTKIVGVEIDPVMVKLGKKYLGLNEYNNLEIKIGDAFNFISHTEDVGKYFDLVLVDVYVGKDIPKELESEKFLRDVKKVLTGSGIVIFNRLRGKERENELNLFFNKLKKHFLKVKVVKPLINQLFICW